MTKTGKRCTIRLTELEELVVSLSIPGSARHSHCRGQGFDSPMLHQKTLQIKACKVFSCPFFSTAKHADPARGLRGNSSSVFLRPVWPRNRSPIKSAHFLVRAEKGLFWARFSLLTREFFSSIGACFLSCFLFLHQIQLLY